MTNTDKVHQFWSYLTKLLSQIDKCKLILVNITQLQTQTETLLIKLACQISSKLRILKQTSFEIEQLENSMLFNYAWILAKFKLRHSLCMIYGNLSKSDPSLFILTKLFAPGIFYFNG